MSDKVKWKEEMITVMQAVKILGNNYTEFKVYRMLRDGRLGGRYDKGIGSRKGSWLVSKKSVELYLENTRILSMYEENKYAQLALF